MALMAVWWGTAWRADIPWMAMIFWLTTWTTDGSKDGGAVELLADRRWVELCWVVCVCLVVSCSPHPPLYIWRLDCWFNTLQLSPLPLFIFESMISWDLCVFRPIVMEWPPQAFSWLCNASHFLYYFSTGSNCKSIWWICYCYTWV